MQTQGLHHRVPHELVILLVYSCCLVLIDKASKEVVYSCLTFLMKVNKCSLQQNTDLTIKIFGILT